MTREEQLKKDLEEFTEEVIRDDPNWVATVRVEYLLSEGIKLVNEIQWWSKFADVRHPWWNEAIEESVTNKLFRKLNDITDEIKLYETPMPIDYDSKITEYDIDRALETPLDYISGLEFKNAGVNSKKAICPFHEEKTASFIWNTVKNVYYCFGCGEGGNVINYLMKTKNMGFKEAVKYLKRY